MDGVTLMVLIFVFIVTVALGFTWYNKKYGRKINVGTVIILVFASVATVFFFAIRKMSSTEKENIIKNISAKTTVVKILTDSHKPYFKDMQLQDGQILPILEIMNAELQVGDSVYKTKGENFYSIVNAKTKSRKNVEVQVHHREMSKPQ